MLIDIKNLIKRYRIWLFFIILIPFCLIALPKIIDRVNQEIVIDKKEIKITVITDIHAGPRNKIEKGDRAVYPKNFEKNIQPALRASLDSDLILSLGDNVDDPDYCGYADELKKDFSGKFILWSKGNHDKDCYFHLNDKKYYYQDFPNAGWRLIVLDADIDTDKDELSWFEETLKTDKKVLVAMHIPFFDSLNNHVLQEYYIPLEKVFSDHKDVIKIVLSGHAHDDKWDGYYNGIHYYIIPSLSTEGYLGYYDTFTLK